jgi:cysteine-S-conjugate beta-lyase
MIGSPRKVWCASPGSATIEVVDLPLVANTAHHAGALIWVDSTRASPLNPMPLTLIW